MNCKKKKNVWFINHYALPPDRPGGTRHYHLASGLASLGYNVKIIAASVSSSGQKNSVSFLQGSYSEKYDGVSFLWLHTPSYKGNSIGRIINMMYFALRVVLLFFSRQPKNKPDLIIGSTVHPLTPVAGWLLSRLYNIPFIYEIRDFWPDTLIELGAFPRNHICARILYLIDRELFEKSAGVIGVLPGINDYAQQRGYRQNNILWLPNGVADKFLNVTIDHNKKEVPWKFSFMYLGAHGYVNKLFDLLNWFHRFENIYPELDAGLILVGNGVAKEKLIQYSQKLNIKKICFMDAVPKEKAFSFLTSADALVILVNNLPKLYRYGISPNKLFDYLSVKKPILLSYSGKFDFVKSAKAGIVVPAEDGDAFVEAMKQMVTMPSAKLKKFGRNGYNYVKMNHSYSALSKKLDGFIQRNIFAGPV